MTNNSYISTYWHVSIVLKERSTDLALNTCSIVGLMVDGLKTDAAGPYHLFLFQTFFFVVKTWRLRYPQCNLGAESSVGDSGVLCSYSGQCHLELL